MTEAQRIGQVFIIGLEKDVLNAAERAAVADFHVASRTRRRPRSRWAKAVALRAASDDAFRTRVDDAALHVLRAKEATGLLSCGG